MENFYLAFLNSFIYSFVWLYKSIIFQVPWQQNYFYGLILISLLAYVLEILFPWRKKQSIIRKDFFLDLFYVFFNFFIFTIIISGFYKIAERLITKIGVNSKALTIISLHSFSNFYQVLTFFVLLDFLQWLTHICLHHFPLLWNFHKVHHSVKEMGFAAHLRYHWMENLLYKPAKVLGVLLLGGFEPETAYIAHFIAITIGHLNHSNIKISYGPFKYIINNPVMHLHHHSYALPSGSIGKNFGISLSLWDYIFRTNYIPDSHGLTKLGFKGDESFPTSFLSQSFSGFSTNKIKAKKNFFIILIIGLCFNILLADSFTSMANKMAHKFSVPVINVYSLKKDLSTGKIILLDARELEEYKISHIKSASHIGYKNFNLERVPNDIKKTDKVIVYCSVGYRSGQIVTKLRKSGYDAYNLYGGIFDWVNKNQPIVDIQGRKTLDIHGYNKDWEKWLKKGKVKYTKN